MKIKVDDLTNNELNLWVSKARNEYVEYREYYATIYPDDCSYLITDQSEEHEVYDTVIMWCGITKELLDNYNTFGKEGAFDIWDFYEVIDTPSTNKAEVFELAEEFSVHIEIDRNDQTVASIHKPLDTKEWYAVDSDRASAICKVVIKYKFGEEFETSK